MPANQGMLFVFGTPKYQCFWMRGMQFPLDIIWLDSNGEINQIKSNILQSTYPEAFCDPQKSSYTIELNAGTARKEDLRVGQILSL